MKQSEIDLVKSLIVQTKTQPSSVYWFLRGLINNQELELTSEQLIEIDKIMKESKVAC